MPVKIYDIRGKYPYEFDERTAVIAANLFLSGLKKRRPLVVLGLDARLSSHTVYLSVLKELRARNCRVLKAGLCTSPMVYFLTHRLGADLGLMVTASHNPAEYNGLKVIIPQSFSERAGGGSLPANPTVLYADFLSGVARLKRPVKAVFDCSNGTAGIVLEKLLPRVGGLSAMVINHHPDGRFPAHGPDPLKSSATVELGKKVVKYKADLGIVFDGDGDRIFFTDEVGKRIDPEIMGLFMARYLLPERVVAGSSVGWTFRRAWSAKNKHKEIIVAPVGHDHVTHAMDRAGASFGLERSGHFYFAVQGRSKRGDFRFDSGLLAALTTINAISSMPAGFKFSDFVKEFKGKYFRENKNIKTAEPYKAINKVRAGIRGGKASDLDGLIIEQKDWWLSLRPSSTEPGILRLNVEATSKKLAKEKFNKILAIVKKP